MEQTAFDQLELRLQSAGRSLRYPATPDIAGRAMKRPAAQPRLAWALAALLVGIASLLAVPSVRARLAEFLQIGGVRIAIPTEYSPAPAYTEPNPGYYGSIAPLADLSGETTLDEAQAMVSFDIPLPKYPAGLGEPDKVYVQRAEIMGGMEHFVILVYLDEQARVEMAVYVLGPGVHLSKGYPDVIEFVEVNGEPAALVRGSHFLRMDRTNLSGVLVKAPALIWEDGAITYRIEANYALEEMLRIAESVPTQE
jgi:hypothetical protein